MSAKRKRTATEPEAPSAPTELTAEVRAPKASAKYAMPIVGEGTNDAPWAPKYSIVNCQPGCGHDVHESYFGGLGIVTVQASLTPEEESALLAHGDVQIVHTTIDELTKVAKELGASPIADPTAGFVDTFGSSSTGTGFKLFTGTFSITGTGAITTSFLTSITNAVVCCGSSGTVLPTSTASVTSLTAPAAGVAALVNVVVTDQAAAANSVAVVARTVSVVALGI